MASRALAAQSRRRIRQYYNQTVAEALRDSVRAERVLADLENNPVKTAEPGVVRSVARNVTAFVFGQSGGTDESVEYHPAIGLITRAPQRDRAEYRFPPEKVRADIVSATVNPPKIVDWYNRLRIGLLGKEPVKSRFGEVLVVETGSGEVLASSFSMNAARDVAAINAAGEANRILAMAQRDGIEEHTYEQMGLDPVGELGKSRGFRRRVAGTPQRRTVGRDLPDRVE